MNDQIAVGDVFRDNDPRAPEFWKRERLITVESIQQGSNPKAVVSSNTGARRTTVSLSRLHVDDRPRTSGYSRVRRAGEET